MAFLMQTEAVTDWTFSQEHTVASTLTIISVHDSLLLFLLIVVLKASYLLFVKVIPDR